MTDKDNIMIEERVGGSGPVLRLWRMGESEGEHHGAGVDSPYES